MTDDAPGTLIAVILATNSQAARAVLPQRSLIGMLHSASHGLRYWVPRWRWGSAESVCCGGRDAPLHEPYRALQAPRLTSIREQLPVGALWGNALRLRARP